MIILLHQIPLTPDGDLVATLTFDTDPTIRLTNLNSPFQPISPSEFIQMMSVDSALREKNGWNNQTHLIGESKTMTMWDRLLSHTNSADGDPQLKALRLDAGVTTNEGLSDNDAHTNIVG